MPATAAGRLTLRTLGHACLALYRDGERPLLLTDPWLVGSVYWRSWWLQNYPSDAELDWLAKAGFVYVTHEHPDHFHMPSIRRLGPLRSDETPQPVPSRHGWARAIAPRASVRNG